MRKPRFAVSGILGTCIVVFTREMFWDTLCQWIRENLPEGTHDMLISIFPWVILLLAIIGLSFLIYFAIGKFWNNNNGNPRDTHPNESPKPPIAPVINQYNNCTVQQWATYEYTTDVGHPPEFPKNFNPSSLATTVSLDSSSGQLIDATNVWRYRRNNENEFEFFLTKDIEGDYEIKFYGVLDNEIIDKKPDYLKVYFPNPPKGEIKLDIQKDKDVQG